MGDDAVSDSRIQIEGLRPSDVALLKQVAAEAAEQSVAKTLTALGIDPAKPFDAQQDMMWLRSTRERCESVGFKAVLTLIGIIVLGAATAFWVGLKAILTGQGAHP